MLPSLISDSHFVIGAALAALGLFAAIWLTRSAPRTAETAPAEPGTATGDAHAVRFLFKDGELADATPGAERLIGSNTRFDGFVGTMRQRFPDLSGLDPVANLARRIPSALPADRAFLWLEKRGSALSVTLHDDGINAGDRHIWLTGNEIADLEHRMIDHAPIAIWSTDAEGALVHANDAFRALVDMSGRDAPFDLQPGDPTLFKRRLWIEDAETETRHWFDLTAHDLPDGTRVFFAASADAVVTAEIAQRNFVQTLTKTFAQLSIGLAIFDRHRQLALFNPALIDLTSLPADFLSARPTLASFFDQLRDRQIMPEPRNYRTWRDQLSDMIDAARDGAYCETWTLPTGLTYKISGKPHPDGAVAFLFEDISAEITLTRRFRAELEQSQAVLDAIDSAIAVFSRTGVLTFANQSFRDLWHCSPDESFIELTIVDVSRIWQDSCDPTPIWGDLRDFVRSVEERADWQDEVRHKTEGPLSVMAAPVTGGATLVRFTAPTVSARKARSKAIETRGSHPG